METKVAMALANQEINELRAALAEARAGRDEAQRARDKARAERDEALRLLESLTPGGSEFHGDAARCVKWIRHAVGDMKQWRVETMVRAKKAEAELDRALEVCKLLVKAMATAIHDHALLCDAVDKARTIVAKHTKEAAP